MTNNKDLDIKLDKQKNTKEINPINTVKKIDSPSNEVQKTKEIASNSSSQQNSSQQNSSQKFNNNQNRNKFTRRRGPRRKNGYHNTEFEERVVNISRVTNVVKGGRRFSFSALVVIGDKKGRVGYGHGKAKEVPEAIKKAIKEARLKLIKVPIIEGTIPHISQSKYVSSTVLIKPAHKGRGIIASGAVRAVIELAGYHDIVTKSLGSSNKTNIVKATIKALSSLKTIQKIALLRDKELSYF